MQVEGVDSTLFLFVMVFAPFWLVVDVALMGDCPNSDGWGLDIRKLGKRVEGWISTPSKFSYLVS